MIIELPKHSPTGITIINKHMKIEYGILKIKFPYSLRKAMYSLTYKMKGKHRCFYCGCEILNAKATLDHLFPQYFGGPTITNNLVPSCMKCNTTKSNMTKEQYEKFLSLTPKERKEYLAYLQSSFEYIRKSGNFAFSKDWTEEKNISDIIFDSSLIENCEVSKINSVKEYYLTYGHFEEALIVDKNNFLLDGFYVLMYAKESNIEKVPVITLENTEVIF